MLTLLPCSMPKRKHEDCLRGGRHQRKAAVATREDEEHEPLATIGGLSPCAFKFIEHWSWGNSSAFEIQELARSVERTFNKVPADVAALASCGSHGHNAANSQRDMLRLPFLQNLKAPDPYYVEANVFLKSGAQTVVSKEEIAIFLPHEWGHALCENKLLDQTFGEVADFKNFWTKVSPEDPKLYANPILEELKNGHIYIPVCLHADKGPHAKQDSLHCISFYSLIAYEKKLGLNESSFLLAAIPTSCCVTANKLRDMNLPTAEATMDTVGRVLSWSFNSWFDGIHPKRDPWGQPLDEKRQSLAGKPICGNGLRCTIWAAPADCEHNSAEYGLPNHNSNSPCMRCKCNRTDRPWNDFSNQAAWKETLYTKEELRASPLTSHWTQSIKGVSHWTYSYDFMHCCDIGFGSAVVANVFYDIFYKELKGKKGDKMSQLLELIKDGYDAVGITEGKISKLTQSHFCDTDAPHKNYPNLLHSAIKAKQTANLVPVCKHLCQKYLDGSGYAKWRLKCLSHLCKLYEIHSDAGLFLTDGQVALYQESATKFLQYYNMLSRYSFELQDSRIGQYQWQQLPKQHYLCHISEDAKWLSPAACWCYPGEHLVGNHTRLAQACLSGMPPHMVPSTVCKKYQVGKHLLCLQGF